MDQTEEKKKRKTETYSPTPWNLYDRIVSVKLHDVNGTKEDKTFSGIVIGHRQIMGIKDTYLIPLLMGLVITALGFSFIKLFFKTDESGNVIGVNGWFIFLECFFLALGISSAAILIHNSIKAKKFNHDKGMDALYLDTKEHILAIRDYLGDDLIIPGKRILSYFRLSGFELTISGIGIKIYSRIFIRYLDDSQKKRWKIVHYIEDPDTTIYWLDMVLHEYKGE